MKKNKNKLDQFHYHEALDRTYMIGNIGEIFLIEHPIFQKHKKLKIKVENALNILAEVYQEIGSIIENSNKTDMSVK